MIPWHLLLAFHRAADTVRRRYAWFMGARTALSVEEYIRTSFPGLDREYRDGEVAERSLPDHIHGRTQMQLGLFFGALRNRIPLYVCSETRVKLREGLILIPDVTVFAETPQLRVPETPPLIAIEILSPDDRLTAVRSKLEDYRACGAPPVWLVHPYSRRLYTCPPAFTHRAP